MKIVVVFLLAQIILSTEMSKKLYETVRYGPETEVEKLIEAGAKANWTDKFAFTALHWASLYGNENIIETLLKNEINIDAQSVYGNTCLMIASAKGHVKIMKMLLGRDCRSEIRNQKGLSALDLAANEECKKLLLDQLNKCFAKAAQDRDFQKMKELIVEGAEINSAGCTILHILTLFKGNESVLKTLKEKDPNINSQTLQNLETPMMWAAASGKTKYVQIFLAKGANAALRNVEGKTALDLAVSQICRTMLVRHNKCRLKKFLIMAMEEGNPEKLHTLIAEGADVHSADGNFGWTALHKATLLGNESIVKALYEYNREINLQTDSCKRTPLMIAAEQKNAGIVKFLLEKGADVSLKDYEGKVALDLAADKECQFLIQSISK